LKWGSWRKVEEMGTSHS